MHIKQNMIRIRVNLWQSINIVNAWLQWRCFGNKQNVANNQCTKNVWRAWISRTTTEEHVLYLLHGDLAIYTHKQILDVFQ